jgi:hypothetical protein
VNGEPLVQQVNKASKVFKVLQEPLVLKGFKVLLVLQEPLVLKVFKVLLVQ